MALRTKCLKQNSNCEIHFRYYHTFHNLAISMCVCVCVHEENWALNASTELTGRKGWRRISTENT